VFAAFWAQNERFWKSAKSIECDNGKQQTHPKLMKIQ
jgi:hypothetical protein